MFGENVIECVGEVLFIVRIEWRRVVSLNVLFVKFVYEVVYV